MKKLFLLSLMTYSSFGYSRATDKLINYLDGFLTEIGEKNNNCIDGVVDVIKELPFYYAIYNHNACGGNAVSFGGLARITKDYKGDFVLMDWDILDGLIKGSISDIQIKNGIAIVRVSEINEIGKVEKIDTVKVRLLDKKIIK